jgi:hypothetical protein
MLQSNSLVERAAWVAVCVAGSGMLEVFWAPEVVMFLRKVMLRARQRSDGLFHGGGLTQTLSSLCRPMACAPVVSTMIFRSAPERVIVCSVRCRSRVLVFALSGDSARALYNWKKRAGERRALTYKPPTEVKVNEMYLSDES